MDLIGVNNSIVKMRKVTIKAKIHIIRLLVKRIKSAKSKKVSNDDQKAQNERKANRYHSEINIIKHLKKDEISRFALLNKQSFLPEINPDKDSDNLDNLLKKRALIRLSNATVMKKSVEEFRRNYPTWEKDLPKVLKNLGKKQAKKEEKKKKEKRKDEKAKKKSAKQPDEDSVNEPKEGESNEMSDIESGAEDASDAQDISDDESESDSESASKQEESKPIRVENKKVGDMEVKQLNLSELIEEGNDEEESNRDLPLKVEPAKIKKDSFFLGGEDSSGEESADDKEEEVESSINNAMSRKRNDFFGGGGRGFENKRGRGQGRGQGFNNRGRGNQRGGRRDFGDSGRGRPSRGFDNRSNFAPRGGNYRGRGGGGNDGFSRKYDSNEQNLHPSWAAKRNQKMVIPSANHSQAKKIRFDEDTSSASLPTPGGAANLHPSWAAKKDNKKGIQAFQGKKVVFGDDE